MADYVEKNAIYIYIKNFNNFML